jgi:hypothetical protein
MRKMIYMEDLVVLGHTQGETDYHDPVICEHIYIYLLEHK